MPEILCEDLEITEGEGTAIEDLAPLAILLHATQISCPAIRISLLECGIVLTVAAITTVTTSTLTS